MATSQLVVHHGACYLRAMRSTLLFLLVLIVQASVRAQGMPSRQQAQDSLRAARTSASIAAANTPFHLTAKIHMEVNGRTDDGTFDWIRESADRYRIEIHTLGASETDVAAGGHLFVSRSTPTMSFGYWYTRGLMESLGASWPDRPEIRRIRPDGSAGNFCVEVDRPWKPDACFDSADHKLISYAYTTPGNESKFSFDDFVDFENVRYARHRVVRMGNLMIEARVQSLVRATPTDADFAPPRPARSFTICGASNSSAKEPTEGDLFGQIVIKNLHSGKEGMAAYYILVGPEGRPSQIERLYPAGAQVPNNVRDMIGHKTMPAHSCGGQGVAYEAVVQTLTTFFVSK
jgi:hypothetical protein